MKISSGIGKTQLRGGAEGSSLGSSPGKKQVHSDYSQPELRPVFKSSQPLIPSHPRPPALHRSQATCRGLSELPAHRTTSVTKWLWFKATDAWWFVA